MIFLVLLALTVAAFLMPPPGVDEAVMVLLDIMYLWLSD
jgi:hypothetical protein